MTMITYGRLSLSGVVGDHPGETTIRKGRSMNIQLMNVARGHHRAAAERRWRMFLTRNNHITAMRDSFALAMPFVIVGSLLVPILFPPVSIDGALAFRPGLFAAAANPAADLSANHWPGGADCRLRRQRQSRQAVPSAGTALRFNRVSGFSAVYRLSLETAVSNVYLGGMGIFTALISSTYSIEIIRFFLQKRLVYSLA